MKLHNLKDKLYNLIWIIPTTPSRKWKETQTFPWNHFISISSPCDFPICRTDRFMTINSIRSKWLNDLQWSHVKRKLVLYAPGIWIGDGNSLKKDCMTEARNIDLILIWMKPVRDVKMTGETSELRDSCYQCLGKPSSCCSNIRVNSYVVAICFLLVGLESLSVSKVKHFYNEDMLPFF